ncbi:hypothetical protein IQ07DRAFT_583012 [Pyrenochaeta sp. DS3sAY3a]|nr:hypothetical protein IQ07DRAFT_583012 [Pyrenochaeta sp. DS3sAY3a]
MSHESVYYSHPRTYGKGSRNWYVHTPIPSLSLHSAPRVPPMARPCRSAPSFPPYYIHTYLPIYLSTLPRLTPAFPPSIVTGSKKKAGLIRKYGLNMSRQAFREKAADIGFVKVRRR